MPSRLEEQLVVEVCHRRHAVAVVDMDGREEQRLRISTRELKSHRVDALQARSQLENREAEVLVDRQLLPNLRLWPEKRESSRPMSARVGAKDASKLPTLRTKSGGLG